MQAASKGGGVGEGEGRVYRCLVLRLSRAFLAGVVCRRRCSLSWLGRPRKDMSFLVLVVGAGTGGGGGIMARPEPALFSKVPRKDRR